MAASQWNFVENNFSESCEAQEAQTAIDKLSSMGLDAKMADSWEWHKDDLHEISKVTPEPKIPESGPEQP